MTEHWARRLRNRFVEEALLPPDSSGCDVRRRRARSTRRGETDQIRWGGSNVSVTARPRSCVNQRRIASASGGTAQSPGPKRRGSRCLGLTDQDHGRHSARLADVRGSHGQPAFGGQPTVEGEVPIVPGHTFTRLRKYVLDRVARHEITMVEASRELGVSRSRLYELKARHERDGEAGLLPKPRRRLRPIRRR